MNGSQAQKAHSSSQGGRINRAQRAVAGRRVWSLIFRPSGRVVWVVSGVERDYQVLPSVDFCMCDDHYFRVISYEVGHCYHVIAQKIAESSGKYEILELQDHVYEIRMKDLRRIDIRRTRLPKAELERIRNMVKSILSDSGQVASDSLLESVKQEGFDVMTVRHLSIILATDSQKRFKRSGGTWLLKDGSSA